MLNMVAESVIVRWALVGLGFIDGFHHIFC